jgi:Nickel responsive protein SCO4226-like
VLETFVILRRGGWRTAEDLQEAAARSTVEGDEMQDDVRWIRSYVTAEPDGTVGTVCIYQASSPEAIRAHASKADLPVDEIVKVADTVVVRSDPVPAAA